MKYRLFICLYISLLLSSCSNKKNTLLSRAYNEMTTRYNIYFNAHEAFLNDLKTLEDQFQDNYMDLLPPHPVYELAKDDFSSNIAGFDVTIEKCSKAIQEHSIRTFPKNGKYSLRRVREQAKIEEFNPFIHRVWLLLGEAQFYKGNLLSALSTFNYISRHFRNRPEVILQARLWMIRSYLAMGWTFDAENLLPLIKGLEVPDHLEQLYNTVFFELYLQKKQYAEALPYLQKAIPRTKNKTQKYRLIYLESQLYALNGNEAKASEALAHVIRMNPPYRVALHAKIRQGELSAATQSAKTIRSFNRMLKDSKNESYKDQILHATGNIHLSRKDTAKALISYAEAIEKSQKNGLEKALSALQMADIYFAKKQYAEAEPYYAIANASLDATHKRSKQIKERAAILAEFAKYYNQAYLQDSLLTLATLPETERNKALQRVIDDVIRKEKLAEERALQEQYEQNKEEYSNTDSEIRPVSPAPGINTDKSWYFYNPELVRAGKELFRKQWGNRKLEDNWRRKDKSAEERIFNPESLDPDAEDATLLADENKIQSLDDMPDFEPSNDPKDINFYLSQLPFTVDQKQAAHKLLEEGLNQVALICKDKLADYPEAIRTFNRLLTDYPDSENKLKILYELYLIYSYTNDTELTAVTRNRILKEFGESDIASIVNDPAYFSDFQNRMKLQEKAYADTYELFRQGDMAKVRTNYQTFITSNPAAKLQPKFMFLNAIATLSEGDIPSFTTELKSLVEKYPKDEVSEIAQNILRGINEGKQLNTNGAYKSNELRVPGESEQQADSIESADQDLPEFEDNPFSPHQLVFIIPKDQSGKNELIYRIARFNFSNFVVREYDIESKEINDSFYITVHGFKSREELFFYENRLRKNFDFMNQLNEAVELIPISEPNFELLLKEKSPDRYFDFYNNLKIEYEKDKNSMGR